MRRLLFLVGGLVFVDTMFFAALTPLLPDYADKYDLSKAGAGVLAGAYPIGVLIGGIDFSDLVLKIGTPVADAKGVVTGGAIIKYGVFLNTIFQFIIVAIAIFLVIKLMNRLIKKEEAAPAPPSAEVVLLTEIRDTLKAKA
ncbi:MAG TPA: MscL family protein [Rudaea sp.]|nr:MscL family protein [Rudaea sp.]